MNIKSFQIGTDIVRNTTLHNKNINKGNSFKDFLKESLENVNSLQIESDNTKKSMVLGDVDNLHEVMIASEKAGIALQMTLTIRNKVVEAYKEIMRMQV